MDCEVYVIEVAVPAGRCNGRSGCGGCELRVAFGKDDCGLADGAFAGIVKTVDEVVDYETVPAGPGFVSTLRYQYQKEISTYRVKVSYIG